MKTAIVQINNTLSIENNYNTIKEYVKRAFDLKVKLIAFPECALTGYISDKDKLVAIKKDNIYLSKLKDLSIKYNIEIFIGSNIYEDNKIYNSYLHITDEIDYYYKTHLGKNEKKIYTPGDKLNLFNGYIKSGIAICVESHIPEVFLTHRLNGAKLVITPFASPINCGSREKVWKKYLLTRAYDNGVNILCTNLTGKLDNLSYNGGLLAVNPRGDIIDEKYNSNEDMLVVDLDVDDKYQDKDYKKNYVCRRNHNLYRRS
jgi:predicted amidohydrolase